MIGLITGWLAYRKAVKRLKDTGRPWDLYGDDRRVIRIVSDVMSLHRIAVASGDLSLAWRARKLLVEAKAICDEDAAVAEKFASDHGVYLRLVA